MKQTNLNELRESIKNNKVTKLSKSTPFFGGADISIVSKIPNLNDDFYGSTKFVITKYAKELSWLIYQLKDVFTDELDYLNKYPFYGRLAERANKSIELNGEDLNIMLTDVLDEAEEMNKEN